MKSQTSMVNHSDLEISVAPEHFFLWDRKHKGCLLTLLKALLSVFMGHNYYTLYLQEKQQCVLELSGNLSPASVSLLL